MDLGEESEAVIDALSTIRQRLRSPRIAIPPFDLTAPVIATPAEVVRKFFRG